MTKTPTCTICHNKLYILENQRKNLGYFCPKCDYTLIKEPTQQLKKLRDKVNEKLNLKSKSGKKPQFGKQRQVTICEKCRLSKYIVCKKVRQTKQRKKQGMTPKWKCECKKCDYIWFQSAPKIRMVNQFQ